MLFVLEGIDGSGKSTLASELVRRLEGEAMVLHRGPIVAPPLIEYLEDLRLYDPRGEAHVVCDRWHLGEQIYGPIYRGTSQVSPGMNLYLDSWLEARGAVLLVISPSFDVVLERLVRRGEEFLKPEHFEQVYRFFARPRPLWLTLENPDVSELLHLGAQMQVRSGQTAAQWPAFVGDTRPEVVFVIPIPGPVEAADIWFSERSAVFEALAATKPYDAPSAGFIPAGTHDLDGLVAALGSPPLVKIPPYFAAEVDRNEISLQAGTAMWELAREVAAQKAEQ